MRLDAAVGFSCDAGGRMLLTNEPREADRRPAPAVWLGRTLPGDELRFGASVPDDLVAEVRARHAAEPALSAIEPPRSGLGAAIGAMLARGGAAIVRRGRA